MALTPAGRGAGNHRRGLARYRCMPSTVIQSFAYDRASAALDVTFLSGRRYRYYLVPPHVAEGMAEAFSKGRYFNARVRDRYPFEERHDAAAASVISRGRGSRQRP